MIESKCPECGGTVVKPDPPARTMDERFVFERAWDARFMKGLRPKQVADPESHRKALSQSEDSSLVEV